MFSKNEEVAHNKGYAVNAAGVVFNKHGKKRALSLHKGYYRFTIRKNKKKVNVLVHRLQAYHKYGKSIYTANLDCCHLNGNSQDNSFDNIVLATKSENCMHKPKSVRIAAAMKATSKIRKYNREEVVRYYKKTLSYKNTMERFNISSKGTLHFILNN